MTQREVYLSIKHDLHRLNMRLIVNRLKDIAWGLIAGGLYLLSVGSVVYVVMSAR